MWEGVTEGRVRRLMQHEQLSSNLSRELKTVANGHLNICDDEFEACYRSEDPFKRFFPVLSLHKADKVSYDRGFMRRDARE